jgi:hypothetical protein
MEINSKLIGIVKKVDKYSPRPNFYSFVMSEKEILLFDKTITNSKVYLEFGTGGGTLRTLLNSSAKIYSVDSDLNCIRSMQRYWLIKYHKNRRLHFFHVDIEPTRELGCPIDEDSRKIFPDYSSSVFSSIEKKEIDTVLIDGRFRIACALRTILECHANKNLVILIHDFWNRPAYFILLKYIREIAVADTLGVFKLRDNINLNFIKEDYELYKFDCR